MSKIDGSWHELDAKDLDFSYRNSALKKNNDLIVLQARFDLSTRVEKYTSTVDNIVFRKERQPRGRSCGSFFKNPSKEQSAGYLLEQVGYR